MQYLKVDAASAENSKRRLVRLMLLDKKHAVKHSSSYVYFPLNISKGNIKKLLKGLGSIETAGGTPNSSRPISHRAILKQQLTKRQYDKAPRGYDIIGNIAVVDIPKGLERNAANIAHSIMAVHPYIETVLGKAGPVSGKFRTRRFKHIAGKKGFVARYKENGCVFEFDVRKTFFSNRLSYERARITTAVKDGENVMVLFAGMGPFAIEIAKAHKKSKVVGIELNKQAVAAFKKNIMLNKLENAEAVYGDVGRPLIKYRNWADRIVVPMPKESLNYLDSILKLSKKKCIVHLYAFGSAESAFVDVAKKVAGHAKANGYKARIRFKRVVRPYSPTEMEIVLDYSINR